MPNQPVHIMIVDDDEVDSEFIIRSFRRHKVENPLIHVSDGVEALNALRGEGGYCRLPRPYLILLDINMPRMGGIEFLHILRQDAELHRSIVFMLTTSNRDEDKIAAYSKQIAGYIVKADVGDDFMNVIRLLEIYQDTIQMPI